MKNRRTVRVLGQRMCSSVRECEVGVLGGMDAPGLQICVLVGTQAALRCTSDTPSRTWIYSAVLIHRGKS